MGSVEEARRKQGGRSRVNPFRLACLLFLKISQLVPPLTPPPPHPQSTGNMATPDERSHSPLGEALLEAPEDAAAPVTSPLLARAATLHDPDAMAWEERLWKEVPQSLWDKIVMRDGVPGLHDSKDICRVLDEALYDPRIHKVCLDGGASSV